MTEDMQKITSDVVQKINHEMSNLKEKYDNIIKILQIETTKVSDKYSELIDLKGLQDSYFSALESIKLFNENIERQSDDFRKEYNEFKKEIKVFRKRSDEEIQNLSENSKSNISEAVSEEFKPLETKLINRQKLIESRILKNEQNYWNLLDHYQGDTKRMSQEFEILKNVLSTQTKANSQPIEDLKKQVNDHIKFIESKVLYFDESINKLQNKVLSYEYHTNMKKSSDTDSGNLAAYFGKEPDNEIKKMILVVKELKDANKLLENKLALMISISLISFIAASIALVLRFI
jgi:hypothetical protein